MTASGDVRPASVGFVDMPVAGKVALLSGWLLLIGAVVGAIGFISTIRMHEAFESYAAASRAEFDALRLGRAFLTTRRFVREHLIGGIDEAASQVGPSLDTLRSALAQARRSAGDPAIAAQIERLSQTADRYLVDYGRASALKTAQRAEVADVLDPLGQAVGLAAEVLQAEMGSSGDAAGAILAARASASITLARLAAGKALGRDGGDEAATVSRTLEEAEDSLARLGASPARHRAVAELRSGIRAFSDSFRRAITIRGSLEALVQGTMRKAAGSIEADIAALAALSALREKELLTADRSLAGLAIEVAAGALACGLAAGTGIAVLLGRAIARPVSRMADAMERLADGDLATMVPAGGRRDEIGRMAVALQTFKYSLAETIRLRHEHERTLLQLKERRRVELVALADRLRTTVGSVAGSPLESPSDRGSAAERTVGVGHRDRRTGLDGTPVLGPCIPEAPVVPSAMAR